MAWIDVKKAYDSVDHGWLNGVILHRFPTGMYRVMLSFVGVGTLGSWLMSQRKGGKHPNREYSAKGCPKETRFARDCSLEDKGEGYRLSKPISFNVPDYILMPYCWFSVSRSSK